MGYQDFWQGIPGASLQFGFVGPWCGLWFSATAPIVNDPKYPRYLENADGRVHARLHTRVLIKESYFTERRYQNRIPGLTIRFPCYGK